MRGKHESELSEEDESEGMSNQEKGLATHEIIAVSRKDKINIFILLCMYTLDGIPLGLSTCIPLILQNRNVSYKEQALFSLVTWPFSVKLLWAPLVDSLYFERIGRRKTWLVPTQYCIGLFMIVLSTSVSSLLGDAVNAPNVLLLTIAFFFMNFLAATQDIALDGWALTILSRRNVGYASVCNSVGQTTGFFLANVVFIALESHTFCNKYLRYVPQTEGLVTLSSFLKFWGLTFVLTATLILIFKPEREESKANVFGIKDTFSLLYRILCLKNIWLIIIFLLTFKIAFSPTDIVTGLKLIEANVPRENLSLLAVPSVPLQILLPVFLSRYTTGPRPLEIFLKAYPYRLMFGFVFTFLFWFTHHVKTESGDFPSYYYIFTTIIYMLHQITVYSIYVALMAFFAQISDPAIGGTYMTLLNTINNLGGKWPNTLALWLVDPLTFKACENSMDSCDTKELTLKCTDAGHKCLTTLDGYYIESIICCLFGFLWLKWGRTAVQRLHHLPLSAWKCQR